MCLLPVGQCVKIFVSPLIISVVCETPDVTAKALASGLDSSGWMKHIKAVLDTSVFIAKVLIWIL